MFQSQGNSACMFSEVHQLEMEFISAITQGTCFDRDRWGLRHAVWQLITSLLHPVLSWAGLWATRDASRAPQANPEGMFLHWNGLGSKDITSNLTARGFVALSVKLWSHETSICGDWTEEWNGLPWLAGGQLCCFHAETPFWPGSTRRKWYECSKWLHLHHFSRKYCKEVCSLLEANLGTI